MQPNSFFRILCVDGNVHLSKSYKLELKAYGLEVITASHGMDAFMQFQAYHGNFRAIVIDNEMSRIRSLPFIRSIRKIGFTGEIVWVSSSFQQNPFDMNLLTIMLLQED